MHPLSVSQGLEPSERPPRAPPPPCPTPPPRRPPAGPSPEPTVAQEFVCQGRGRAEWPGGALKSRAGRTVAAGPAASAADVSPTAQAIGGRRRRRRFLCHVALLVLLVLVLLLLLLLVGDDGLEGRQGAGVAARGRPKRWRRRVRHRLARG